ncbi:RNA 2'-phosphotransferase [Mucilaginibacter paludis]|uniref:Probable RNA 2'-phosphotransferase n=1 Tax=Mucilaginibacter paludis DSM 18603 TaxID=714943 RepID=H1YCY3_9SPHI|nr:RNA 2'-phosphotransferase [Mucilaginibacter paludis]EHQ25154.1 RNA 2'-phosphotransferase [Mucilaginibacter paludis DSM 18603]
MISEKQITSISKFLSLVLRHQPELIGIEMDEQGWVKVTDLLEKANAHGKALNMDVLKYVVDTNAKKRFAFDESQTYIRASQGHSVEVELGYLPQIPPEILYHGTGSQSVDAILKTGLEKRARQHVHLSHDVETATKVGSRHGKPVILKVLAADMHQQGYAFYLSENKVWITDGVPAQFLEVF